MINKRIWTIPDSGEGFAILDSTKASGGDWLVGGCAIFAFALKEYFGEGNIVVIYNHRLKRVEHFGLEYGGLIIDGAGAFSSGQEWRDHLEEEANGVFDSDVLRVEDYKHNMNIEDIVIDMEASKELAKLIKEGL